MTAAIATGNKAPYGARQLKSYIAFSTYRAFILTNLLLAVIFVGIPLLLSQFAAPEMPRLVYPKDPIFLGDYKLPETSALPRSSGGGNAAGTGSKLSGGVPLPVPPGIILNTDPVLNFGEPFNPDPALNGNGEPVRKDGLIPGGNGQGTENNVQPVEPEFVAVDKEPVLNMSDLQRVLEYPEIAKRAGISGKVILRVLVGANGKAEDISVVSSPNDVLSEAAVAAIKRVSFTPAVQNAENVRCWLMVPIDFRLR